SARRGPSAVWTGGRMIIWGGADDIAYLDTGGRFDPLSNAWTPTPTTNAPYPRGYHATVWTGDLMLVWGGQTSSGATASGGRYCVCQAHYRDMDGDGYGDPADSVMICGMAVGYVSNAEDCNDSDSGVWARPTEVRQLLLPDRATLTWSAPVSAGANTVAYDLLRPSNRDDFV